MKNLYRIRKFGYRLEYFNVKPKDFIPLKRDRRTFSWRANASSTYQLRTLNPEE